jgi:hypothetical protein
VCSKKKTLQPILLPFEALAERRKVIVHLAHFKVPQTKKSSDASGFQILDIAMMFVLLVFVYS